ncbi:HWE histidine kinase domain-containing protein [Sulfitobacter sp. HNIBRBA3233]|uniref:sensor histidine kinase n=1 Tax=Sulfitobacter marinivivus TaxID=3158558 RepID=UPI0032E029DD
MRADFGPRTETSRVTNNDSGRATGLSDADYRRHFRSLPAQLIILDRDLRVTDANDTFVDNTIGDRDALIGAYVFDVLPSPDNLREPIETALRAALEGEETHVEELYYPVPDPDAGPGAVRDVWWRATHRPLRDTDGNITHVVQFAEPITERIRAQKLSAAILDELEHRIGNLMALVLTIAKRIGRASGDFDSFMPRFEARVMSLAATQKLLTGENWRQVTMQELAEKHLAPYRSASASSEIVMRGPRLNVTAPQAQAISMALHELTTNSAKYGALATAGAILEIEWSGVPEEDFRLEWKETGLSLGAPPTRTGFGSEILTTIFPAQMSADAHKHIDGSSFTYMLETAPR